MDTKYRVGVVTLLDDCTILVTPSLEVNTLIKRRVVVWSKGKMALVIYAHTIKKVDNWADIPP
jgi:hypothetical protein